MRIAIATRNTARCVDSLRRAAGLDADTFAPVLTREGPHPDKPDPAIALAACKAWGIRPQECLMVGDSMDDMRCGRAAGMATCFVVPPDVYAEHTVAPCSPLAAEVDFCVATLAALQRMLSDAVDPE